MSAKDYTGLGHNNLTYLRRATMDELRKRVPQSCEYGYTRENRTIKINVRVQNNRHVYWLAECVECRRFHVVRSDKIKGKRCRCTGPERETNVCARDYFRNVGE